MSLVSPPLKVFYAEHELEFPPDWVEKGKRLPKIRDAFRTGGARYQLSQFMFANGLDDLPLAEMSDQTGVCESQISRLRNDGSASVGVLLLLIAARNLRISPLPHAVFSAIGAVEAVRITTFLEQTTLLRDNRVPKPKLEMPLLDAFWLTSLMASNLYEPWNSTAKDYHNDLREAFDKKEFRDIYARLKASFLEQTHSVPELKNAGERYQATGSQAVTALCLDVDRVWRHLHKLPISKTTFRNAWDAIEMMTPWCG